MVPLVTPIGTKGSATADVADPLPTGTKGPLLSRLLDPGQKGPPFVPPWRSRLGNRDNRIFLIGTKGLFYSSVWRSTTTVYRVISNKTDTMQILFMSKSISFPLFFDLCILQPHVYMFSYYMSVAPSFQNAK